MSRHEFSDIVSNCDAILDRCNDERDAIIDKLGEDEAVPDSTEPRDVKGYSLYDWQRYGEIGWDPMQETYFIQLVFHEGEPDEQGWWLGTSDYKIPDFRCLCETLNKIFNVPVGFFQYVDCIRKL